MIRRPPIDDSGASVAPDFCAPFVVVLSSGFFYILVDMTGRVSRGSVRGELLFWLVRCVCGGNEVTGAGGIFDDESC